MHFRIGVHLGDVIEKPDGTVYGDGVNVAARLEGLAQPGGITVSDSVRGVVSGRVVATFTDQGEQTLKNIARPIRAFAIDLGLAAQRGNGPGPGVPSVTVAAPRRWAATARTRRSRRPAQWPPRQRHGRHRARRACSSAASRNWRSSARRWTVRARGAAGWCCWPDRAAWARPGWRSNWQRRPKRRACPCCGGAASRNPARRRTGPGGN